MITVLIIAVCIVIAGYYAGFETGSYCLNRIRLRYRLERNYPSAQIVNRLLISPERLVSTSLVGQNLVVFLATLTLTHSVQNWVDDSQRAELLATLILALPMHLFSDVIPKDLFRRAPDTLVYLLARSFQFSFWLFRPVTVPLKLVNTLLRKLVGWQPAAEVPYTRARLHHFFAESASEGVLSPYQSTMAGNIMKLREISVARIMVPIPSVVTIPSNATAGQVRQLAEKIPHRRYPVRDAFSGTIVGVVNILDLLQDPRPDFSIARHIRRPAFIRADKSVLEALKLLRRSSLPVGLVVDEAGEIQGMITVKDVVEEIVGELGVW